MAYTTIDNPELFFNTVLYAGNGSTNAITGVGFQPDFVWLKDRTAANSHKLYDGVRGATKYLISDVNNAEATQSNGLTSFDSDGFTLGSYAGTNNSSNNYVSWNWLAGGSTASNGDGDITSTVSANTTAGFSVVKYTGNGNSSATFGHGLGVKPKIGLLKPTSTTGNWNWWQDTTGNNSADVRVHLHLSDANNSNYPITFNTDTITLPSLADASWNGSGTEFIFYCFAEKKGYSKFGSYTGNGNADGTFVYTGFRPAFVIVKRTDVADNWFLLDNKRNTFNPEDKYLLPDTSGAETTYTFFDFLSNGFKIRSTGGGHNASGGSYIYMAFAEHPFVTEGTKAAGTAR
jgi:hypothetical protein